MTRMPQGSALAFLADHTAMYSNMPDFRDTETRIIIPVSSAMVLKSTPLIASCWSSTPIRIMKPAPTSAMTERLTFSLMMMA